MTEEQKKDLVLQAKQLPPRALEIAQQLKLMVSNGQKLAPEEILTLASFAYREGLDPLNGECWYIKGKGCMVGIKGLRRKATEALGYEDVWYPEYRDITQTYDTNDKEVLYAYECTIRNTRATARWLRLQAEAKPLNFTGEQTIQAFGHPPVWVGVGVIRKNEYASPTYPQRTRCKKRAEAAAINAMMGFGYDIMDEDKQAPIEIKAIEKDSPNQDDAIDAEFTHSETSVSDQPTTAEDPFTDQPSSERPVVGPDPELITAEAIVGHDGIPYGQCTTEVLKGKRTGIVAKLNNKDTLEIDKPELLKKLDAINTIIESRG